MTTEHDVSTEKQPPVSPPTPEKSKLPFTIGQLGMWIFISTEVMLFAGIIAVYLVLRLTTLQSGWPTRTDMHVYTETGITMTIFLVFSAAYPAKKKKQMRTDLILKRSEESEESDA